MNKEILTETKDLPDSSNRKFKELKTLNFIEESKYIIFSGNPGTGLD